MHGGGGGRRTTYGVLRTMSRTYGVRRPGGRPRDGSPATRRTSMHDSTAYFVPGTATRGRVQGAVDPFVGRSRPAFVVDGIAGCGRGPCGPDRRAGARPHR